MTRSLPGPDLPARVLIVPSLWHTNNCPVPGRGLPAGLTPAAVTPVLLQEATPRNHILPQAFPEGNFPLPVPTSPSSRSGSVPGPAMRACGITHACSLATCAPDRLLGSYLTGSPTALREGSSPHFTGKPRVQLREDEVHLHRVTELTEWGWI